MLVQKVTEVMPFLFCLVLVVVHLVIVVLHPVDLRVVLVLQVVELLHELVFELVLPMMVLFLNRLVLLVIFFHIVFALFLYLMQRRLKAVDGVLDLVDLGIDSARVVMVNLMVVLPIVVDMLSLAVHRALDDTLMPVVVEVILIMVVLVMSANAQIDDMNGLVVDEDVDIDDAVVQMDELVGDHVEVDLTHATQVWVLSQAHILLNLLNMEDSEL